MVGTEYEQGGIIKAGSQMINAVSNSKVPHLTVTLGASYGAGNYGMCGRAYGPRFLFTWPNAKSAVMGPAQLAGVLDIVGRQSAAARGLPYDEEAAAQLRASVEEQIEAESLALFLSARLYDDGIIDPRDTRTVLGNGAVGHRQRADPRCARRFRGVPAVKSVLVANRGEIARRIFRSAAGRGMRTVAVYSDADADAPFVREADAAVRLPGGRACRHLSARRSHHRCRRSEPVPMRSSGIRVSVGERRLCARRHRGRTDVDRTARVRRSKRWAPRPPRRR